MSCRDWCGGVGVLEDWTSVTVPASQLPGPSTLEPESPLGITQQGRALSWLKVFLPLLPCTWLCGSTERNKGGPQ